MSRKLFVTLLVGSAIAVGCSQSSDNTAASTTGTSPASAAPKTSAPATSAASDNSIVGSWSGTDPKSGEKGTFEFKADNTFTMSSEKKDIKGTEILEGTYKQEGDKVTLTATSMKASTSDPSKQKDVDAMNAQAAEVLKKGGQPPLVISIAFPDKNTMSMTNQPGPDSKSAPETITVTRQTS